MGNEHVKHAKIIGFILLLTAVNLKSQNLQPGLSGLTVDRPSLEYIRDAAPIEKNDVDRMIDSIDWEKEIQSFCELIFFRHFKARDIDALNEIIFMGTFNSLKYYTHLSEQEIYTLQKNLKTYFFLQSKKASTQTMGFDVNEPYAAVKLISTEDTSGATVFSNAKAPSFRPSFDLNYFQWMMDHVFKSRIDRSIFAKEPIPQKYAALFKGMTEALDPNSWFSYDQQSYLRSSYLMYGSQQKSSLPDINFRKSTGQVFSFGSSALKDRVLYIHFAHELVRNSGAELQTYLLKYRDAFDAVVYDFENTLGGVRVEFEKFLEPFVGLEDQAIMLASFYDRDQQENKSKRMLLRSMHDPNRLWKEPLLSQILLVKMSPVSQSGAEIVAMGVQDLGLGVVVGQNSGGKMTAAKPYLVGPLPLWLTEYKFFGPKGRSPKYIKPDIEFALKDDRQFLRNYEKPEALNHPRSLMGSQFTQTLQQDGLFMVDTKNKQTTIQNIVARTFLRNKTFKKHIKNTELNHLKTTFNIAKILGALCSREQLVYTCDEALLSQELENLNFYQNR